MGSATSACCQAGDYELEKEIFDRPVLSGGSQSSWPLLQRQAGFAEEHLKMDATLEDLAWFNSGLQILWPHFDRCFHKVVSERMWPMFRESLPEKLKQISLQKLSIGKSAPSCGPLRVYKLPFGGGSAHFTLTYSSDFKVDMTHPEYNVDFGVDALEVVGEFVIHIRPFAHGPQDGFRCGAYFVNPPHLHLGFSGLGVLAELPMFRGLVQSAANKAFAAALVLPNASSFFLSLESMEVYPLMIGNWTPLPVGMLRARMVSLDHRGMKHDILSIFRTREKLHLHLHVGHDVWHSNDAESHSHDFIVFDVAQKLYISLRDESDEEQAAVAGPYSLEEAYRLSGSVIELVELQPPHRVKGKLVCDFEWLDVVDQEEISGSDNILMVKILHINMPGLIEESSPRKFFVRGLLAKDEKLTPAGTVMMSKVEVDRVNSILSDMQSRLRDAKVDEDTIKKVTELEGLQATKFTKIAINSCLSFTVSANEAERGNLILRLMERDANGAEKQLAEKTVPLCSAHTHKDGTMQLQCTGGTGSIEAAIEMEFHALASGVPPSTANFSQTEEQSLAHVRSTGSVFAQFLANLKSQQGRSN